MAPGCSGMSEKASNLKMSAPAPPVSVSCPDWPLSVSLPAPPRSVSSPAAPMRMSIAEATGKGVVAPIAGDGVVAGAADHVLDVDQGIGADVDAFRLADGRVGRIVASKQQVADRPSPVCGLKVAVGEIEVDGDAVCGR